MTDRPAVTEATRHLTASAVVIDIHHRKVLLVWHLGYKRWQVPGGHLEPDETGAEAAIREVLEETGVPATLWTENRLDVPGGVWHPAPLLVCEFPHPGSVEWGEPPHQHIDELYLAVADSTAPTARQEDEVGGVRWWPIDALDGPGIRADVPVVVPVAWRILGSQPLHEPGI